MKELPNGWKSLAIADIVAKDKYSLKRGPFGGSLKKEIFVPKGYKVYEQKHAIQNNFEIGGYYITKEKYEEMIEFAVKPADLIISCSGTIGKVAIVPLNAQDRIINQALLKITLNKNIALPEYIKHLLETKKIQRILFEGRGSGIKNVAPMDKVRGTIVPIPPLPIQKQIVSILERAEKLKERRQISNEETNKIIQNIFYKMFGDPIKNEKKVQSQILKDISKEIQTGFAFGNFDKTEGIPHLRPFNITKSGNICFEQIKYVPEEAIKNEKYVLVYGDIILNTTNSAELVGKATIFNERKRCAFSNHMTKIRLAESKANKYYLSTLLNIFYEQGMFKPMLKRWVNQVGIESNRLKELSLPLPPISLQNQFAEIVKKIEAIKEKQKQSTEDINTLFDALMQKAFNGELV